MEFEILWSEADFISGLTPVMGRKIGFDISNNQGESSRTAQFMWNQKGTNRN